MLVYCIFEVKNPDSREEHVTGESAQVEYDLRKCIAYDAIEYRGTYGQLSTAWLNEQPPPPLVDVDLAELAEEGGAGGASGASSARAPAPRGSVAVVKKEGYLRPCNADQSPIVTTSGAALTIKRSAALMLSVIMDRIIDAHAHSDVVRVDVDVFTFADDPAVPNDWLWYFYIAIATWLLFMHIIAFYFVGGRIWSRVRARFANSHVSVAVQCYRLPDIPSTTVEGLRSELRARGLRTTGLRKDLEMPLAAVMSESEQ